VGSLNTVKLNQRRFAPTPAHIEWNPVPTSLEYAVRGRYRIIPKHPLVLAPDDLTAWAREPFTSKPSIAISSAKAQPDEAVLQTPDSALTGAPQPPHELIAEPGRGRDEKVR
jgi:hypothetical protein